MSVFRFPRKVHKTQIEHLLRDGDDLSALVGDGKEGRKINVCRADGESVAQLFVFGDGVGVPACPAADGASDQQKRKQYQKSQRSQCLFHGLRSFLFICIAGF